MSDVAELMKRCQRGVGGRNALDEAHDIMAECYGTLGRLESERAALEAKCANLENSLLAITARHFAESWKKRTSDAELEQYLSAGIAQLESERAALEAECERLREALEWYAEKAKQCRKFGPDGDNARQALDLDGGFRALDALAASTGQEGGKA